MVETKIGNMKDKRYMIIILSFLLIILLLYFLFKNMSVPLPEQGMETNKQDSHKAAIKDMPEGRSLFHKGKKKSHYDVFKSKTNTNTEEGGLEYRLRSGDAVI